VGWTVPKKAVGVEFIEKDGKLCAEVVFGEVYGTASMKDAKGEIREVPDPIIHTYNGIQRREDREGALAGLERAYARRLDEARVALAAIRATRGMVKTRKTLEGKS
jgi:hypothetical protein